MTGGFVVPDYPYDRLDAAREAAARLPGGVVDLSVGTPTDPPPPVVTEALAAAIAGPDGPDPSASMRGYPPSIGTIELRQAIQQWEKDTLGAEVPLDAIAICVGTKELVAGLPQWCHLRNPDRDTVLYPAVSYPTYAMGARPRRAAGRAGTGRRALAPGPGRRGSRGRRPGPDPVGQHARQPGGWPRRLGRGGELGAGPGDPGGQRRVLRRVHLGRPGPHGAGPRGGAGRSWGCAGRALPVQALQPGRDAGRLVQRRPGAGGVPARDPQARRFHGAGTGAAGGGRGPR